MKLLKKTRTIALSLGQSAQVRLALASTTVVGIILAAGAGTQWN